MRTTLKHKNRILTKEAYIYESPISQAIGMMFNLRPKTLIFPFNKEKRVSIHSVFVFFPLDLLFLDKSKKIVEIRKGLPCFYFYFPRKKARYIVEMPHKSIRKHKLKIGHKLNF